MDVWCQVWPWLILTGWASVCKILVFSGDTRSLQYSSAFWSVRVLPMRVRPMQGRFGPRSWELPSGSGKNIKATADCGCHLRIWVLNDSGQLIMSSRLLFTGSQVVSGNYAWISLVFRAPGAARHGHHGNLGNSRGGSGKRLGVWWIWSCGDWWFITKTMLTVYGEDDEDDVDTSLW